MKIWNIILKQNSTEEFDFECPINEHKLIAIIDDLKGNASLLSTNVFDTQNHSSLVSSNNAFDFLNIALGIYTVDQVVSRALYGYQGWSRHFRIYIPVNDVRVWNLVKEDLETLLSFLSGDKWQIIFRQNKIIRQVQFPLDSNLNKVEKVCLFSGGLDSFIAAINIIEEGKKVIFISHYKRGSESHTQTELYNAMTNQYGQTAFEKFKFYVQPNQRFPEVSKENTSRARSFLFFALGITIANTLGNNIEFIIPENGLISLNVPLTTTRLSSHSTRTTHPFYISKLKSLLSTIGIKNPIVNPYQFETKGEMMINCKNQTFLKSCYEKTLSCSHPDNSRLIKGQKPGIHCGYCVPCLIRQASEYKSGNSKTTYSNKIKTNPISAQQKSGRDIRAFKIAIKGLTNLKSHNLGLYILNSGPLPFENKKELDLFIDVYERGMKEVADFLI
ncbi:MAG: Qat anti-phage system QueC-like protein QatC [Bacteroidota bacterium]|nr:Qat anti-phage system QueC-like protein QatC [Bacteroidota bacterium]